MLREGILPLFMFTSILANAQGGTDISKGDLYSVVGSNHEQRYERWSYKPDSTQVPVYSIVITVTNIRNHTGYLRFKFYDDSRPFPDDMGFLKIVIPKTEITGDSITFSCRGFKSQYMGIALLDDENNNNKLDFGFFLPKEGHAFADYYHTAWRRPVYDDFRFFLDGDKHVIMKMKYY